MDWGKQARVGLRRELDINSARILSDRTVHIDSPAAALIDPRRPCDTGDTGAMAELKPRSSMRGRSNTAERRSTKIEGRDRRQGTSIEGDIACSVQSSKLELSVTRLFEAGTRHRLLVRASVAHRSLAVCNCTDCLPTAYAIACLVAVGSVATRSRFVEPPHSKFPKDVIWTKRRLLTAPARLHATSFDTTRHQRRTHEVGPRYRARKQELRGYCVAYLSS